MESNDKNLNTIYYIYDDIKKVVNSCVIKYENIAKSYETAETMRNFDHYLIAYRKIDTFDSYRTYPLEVIMNAGILDVEKAYHYATFKDDIPKERRQRILEENRKYILSHYIEKNNYYRMLIGLPDVEDGEDDFVYLDYDLCERYHLNPFIPIHQYTDDEIHSISFHMDDIINKYPDKKYLNFLGYNKVDLVRARTAKNFEIIRADLSSHIIFLKSFFSTYNLCREYFTSVIYRKEKYYDDKLYDNFIAMSIMLMCIQRMLVNTVDIGVKRDFYDLHSIQAFFNSYGIPFFETLPLDFQRIIMKRTNILLRSKSTDRCLFDISELLFIDRAQIMEYYLVKEPRYDDNGIPIQEYKEIEDIDGSIEIVEDIDKMYDIYFQAVDKKERNINLAIEDESNRVDYEEMIEDDPFWWDDDDVRRVLTEKDFNYINTKYIGINIMYNMTDLLFETVYFLNMLVDKKNQIHRPQLNFSINIKLPRITASEVSIFDAVILLFALVCKKNHFKGNIIKTGTKILSVKGFDFEENFKLIREEISNNAKIYDQETLKYIEKMNINSKEDINYLFNNLVGLAEFCKDKMNNTDDVKVFHAYRYLYDTLMIKKYTTNILKKENGEVADTYLDYLHDQNPFLADFVESCTIEQTGVYIDHILGTLNELVPDIEYLSHINGTNNIIITALIKLIEFFKSYTVEMKTLNILYLMDDKRYNMIRMVSDIFIVADWELKERLSYYIDHINIHSNDECEEYIKMIEIMYYIIKLKCDDNINVNDNSAEDLLIKIKTVYMDIFSIVYNDFIESILTNTVIKNEVLLESMQNFIAKILNSDNINYNIHEMTLDVVSNLSDVYNIKYVDPINYINDYIYNNDEVKNDDSIYKLITLLMKNSFVMFDNSFVNSNIHGKDIIKDSFVISVDRIKSFCEINKCIINLKENIRIYYE